MNFPNANCIMHKTEAMPIAIAIKGMSICFWLIIKWMMFAITIVSAIAQR